MKSALLFFFSIFFCAPTFAQSNTDQQLANLYYTQGEYEKAVTYFEKIINKQSSKFDQLRYIECLEKTKQEKEAEKQLKKLVASNESEYDYTIILGDLYERTDRKEQQTKVYKDLIKRVATSGYQVTELYSCFVKKGKADWALQTLEIGRKELKKNYPLQLQFAEVYSILGRTEEMIDEYFDLMDDYPNYASNVQTELSKQIDFQEDKNGAYGKL